MVFGLYVRKAVKKMSHIGFLEQYKYLKPN
jgi:hypothetical protein